MWYFPFNIWHIYYKESLSKENRDRIQSMLNCTIENVHLKETWPPWTLMQTLCSVKKSPSRNEIWPPWKKSLKIPKG
jgi:hypothetical protein